MAARPWRHSLHTLSGFSPSVKARSPRTSCSVRSWSSGCRCADSPGRDSSRGSTNSHGSWKRTLPAMADRAATGLAPVRGTPTVPGMPLRAPLRLEGELLLHCARADLSRETAERVAELARADLDWDLVFRLGIRHGTIPRLHLHLAATCPGVAPPAVTARIRAQYGYNSVRNLTHARELIRLLGALDAGGVEALAYKGPTLAAHAYGDL